MLKTERRGADRFELESKGIAIINGTNVEVKTSVVSKLGGLIEFKSPVPVKKGMKFRLHLDIGFIGRVSVCDFGLRDDYTLCGISFDRFEFGSDRALIEYLVKHEENSFKNAAKTENDDFVIKEYYQSKTIFKEGEVGETAYILKRGRVGISKMVQGKKIPIAVLVPGSIFGELALLTKNQERTASAEALEIVEVIEIHKHKFEALLDKSPVVISSVLRALSKRIIESTATMAQQKEMILRARQQTK